MNKTLITTLFYTVRNLFGAVLLCCFVTACIGGGTPSTGGSNDDNISVDPGDDTVDDTPDTGGTDDETDETDDEPSDTVDEIEITPGTTVISGRA